MQDDNEGFLLFRLVQNSFLYFCVTFFLAKINYFFSYPNNRNILVIILKAVHALKLISNPNSQRNSSFCSTTRIVCLTFTSENNFDSFCLIVGLQAVNMLLRMPQILDWSSAKLIRPVVVLLSYIVILFSISVFKDGMGAWWWLMILVFVLGFFLNNVLKYYN